MNRRSCYWCLFIVIALLGGCRTNAGAAEAGSPISDGSAAPACVVAAPPDALLSLARCCARDLHSNSGCRYFNAAGEYIILKDNSRRKPAAYLIIPTIAVSGIEAPQIFAPPIIDFWEYGWRAAAQFVKKPPAETALAINSKKGRTENQLHIHIACVLPAVAAALDENAERIGLNPAAPLALALSPKGHVYRIVKATALAGTSSPFDLVAAMPGARIDMDRQSIAVVGSSTPGSYYVLDTQAGEGNPGAAEELLDQTCGG